MLLTIDTTGRLLALALHRGPDAPVFHHVEDAPMRQVERLFPALGDALAGHGIRQDAITRVAAITGPGSYTGIRAGLAAVLGLAQALGVPALGIGGLEALAEAAADAGVAAPVFVALPVGRGRWAGIAWHGPSAPAAGATQDVAWVAAGELARAAGDLPLVVAAEGEEAGELPARLRVPMAPRLDAAARLLWAADPPARPPEPCYLRPVQLGPAAGR